MTRHRDQRGASLIIVLALTAFIGITVSAVLSLSFTGAGATIAVKNDRGRRSVAVSALDSTIQNDRTARWVGRVGLECPTTTLTSGNWTATVTCVSTTGPFDLDRTISYTVKIGGTTFARAKVIYRDATAGTGEPAVDVVSWNGSPV